MASNFCFVPSAAAVGVIKTVDQLIKSVKVHQLNYTASSLLYSFHIHIQGVVEK